MRPDEEGERPPRAPGDRSTPLPDSPTPRALGMRRHTTSGERWVPMNKEFLQDIFERTLRSDISGEGGSSGGASGAGVVRRRSLSPPRDSSRYSDISEATPDEDVDSEDGKSVQADSDSDVILVSAEAGAPTLPSARTPGRPSLGDPAPAGPLRVLPWGVPLPPGAHPGMLQAAVLADPRARYRTECPVYPPGLLLPPCCARELESGRGLAGCHHRSLAHWHTAALYGAPPSSPGHGLGLLHARLRAADDMVIIGSGARRPLMRRRGSVGNHSKTVPSDERSPATHLNRCPQSAVMTSLEDRQRGSCSSSNPQSQSTERSEMSKSELINQNIHTQDNNHHSRKTETKSAAMQQQSFPHNHASVHSDFANRENNTNFVIYRPGPKRKSRSSKTRVERQQWIGISKEAIAGILDNLMVSSMSGEDSAGDSRSNSPASATTTDTDDNGNNCDSSPVTQQQKQQQLASRLLANRQDQQPDRCQTLSTDSSYSDSSTTSDRCRQVSEESNSVNVTGDSKCQEMPSGDRNKENIDRCQNVSPVTKHASIEESSKCSRVARDDEKVARVTRDDDTSSGPASRTVRTSPGPPAAQPGREGDQQQAPKGWVLLTQPLISSMMEEAFTREISPTRDGNQGSRSPTPEVCGSPRERVSPSGDLQESSQSPTCASPPQPQPKVDQNQRAIALLLDMDFAPKPPKPSGQPGGTHKRRLTADGAGPSQEKTPRLQTTELPGVDLRISKKTSDKLVASHEPPTWCGSASGGPGMWPSSGPASILVPGSSHLSAPKSCQHFSQGQVLPQNPLLTPQALAYIERLKSSNDTAINLATKTSRDPEDPSRISKKGHTCQAGSSQQLPSHSTPHKPQTDDIIDLVAVSPERVQSKPGTDRERLATSRGPAATTQTATKLRRSCMEPRPGWVAVSKDEVHTIMDSLTSQLFSAASVSDPDQEDSGVGSRVTEDRTVSGSEDSPGGSGSVEDSQVSGDGTTRAGPVCDLGSGSGSDRHRDGSSPNEEFRRTTIDALNAVYRHEDGLGIEPPTLTAVRTHAREESLSSSDDRSPPSVDSLDTAVTMTTIVREHPVRDPAAQGEDIALVSPRASEPESPDPDTRTATDPHTPDGDKKTSFNWKKSILQRVQDDHHPTTELPPFPSPSGSSPDLAAPSRAKASPRRSPHNHGSRNSKKGKRKHSP